MVGSWWQLLGAPEELVTAERFPILIGLNFCKANHKLSIPIEEAPINQLVWFQAGIREGDRLTLDFLTNSP